MSARLDRVGPGTLHDFKNLLTVISGHSELMLSRLKEGDPLWRSAEAIRRAVESGVSLTSQWLAAARHEAAPAEVVEVNDLVATVGRMLDGPLGSAIEFALRFDDQAGRVRVSRAEIEQVLVNLAMNARDAMPDGGRLAIETSALDVAPTPARRLSDPPVGTWAVVSVTDTGSGMEPWVSARLFEPYFTTKPGRGTGLGLATARAIVRRHGGDIMASTAARRGSTFRVYLPRVLAVHAREKPASRNGASALDGAAMIQNPRGTETVLVVETDAEVRALIYEVLTLHGYTVLSAASVKDAQALAARHTGAIDLVMVDALARRYGGRALPAELRRARPRLKALYVSGLTDQQIARRGGSVDGPVLRKPFSVGGLTRRVRQVLDG